MVVEIEKVFLLILMYYLKDNFNYCCINCDYYCVYLVGGSSSVF